MPLFLTGNELSNKDEVLEFVSVSKDPEGLVGTPLILVVAPDSVSKSPADLSEVVEAATLFEPAPPVGEAVERNVLTLVEYTAKSFP